MSVIRVQLPRAPDNVALHDRINAAIVEAVDRAGSWVAHPPAG